MSQLSSLSPFSSFLRWFLRRKMVLFCWWVLQHSTGVARLVWGRLRVHRAFIYSNWFVCSVCFCSLLPRLTLLLSFLDILHCLPRAVGVPLESALNLVSPMSPSSSFLCWFLRRNVFLFESPSVFVSPFTPSSHLLSFTLLILAQEWVSRCACVSHRNVLCVCES